MRNNKTLADVLIAYTDQLIQGGGSPNAWLEAFPQRRQELAALLNIATRLKTVLLPVRPDRVYREALRIKLVEAAGQKMRPRVSLRNPFTRRRLLIVSAAVTSALSVAVGIVAALLIRNRALQKANRAPSA